VIKQYDAEIIISGGGIAGQSNAIRLWFAKSLIESNPEWRLTLKPYGMLVRDARIKERKKPGLKKARKAPTWSKR
jgi:small subunit ribosomal protein S9